MRKSIMTILSLAALNAAQAQDINEFKTIENPNGATIGYSPKSGIKILTVGKLKFKDLNKNGKLDIYEDWRRPAEERAKDLAGKMSIEQISGLMLYSLHQAIPSPDSGFGSGTYNGEVFSKANVNPYILNDLQKKFLKEDNLRHILITKVKSPEAAALWNNNMQGYVEGLGLGIPGNTSSDPRNGTSSNAEFNAGAGGAISTWPDGLGLAATFDPEVVRQFGSIAGREYRALGIATALSPQIDLGSEPRWYRIIATFGEHPQLSADMARGYIDGFQTSTGKSEIKDGWGFNSVNAMVKHWPSGGAEEGGRDGHYAYGKFAVYPGNNLSQHLIPFTEGAFKLAGKTQKAAAVMPYYTITYGQDPSGNNVANSYSKYMITDLLRKKYNYDGVVCTDWIITANEGATPNVFEGKPWGAEKLSVEERHYKILMAGVDQFGGNNDMKPVIAAYKMGVKEHGEKFMRIRFEQSAVRLLKNIFRVGLFENPYLNVEETKKTVGNPEFMKAGFDAQVKSIVMLKNKANVMPIAKNKTVYIPKLYRPMSLNWWGNPTMPTYDYPVDINMVKRYYNVTEDPLKADFAIVFASSPNSADAGYNLNDRKEGGNGYVPISLQYGTYMATDARAQSIAAGDPVIDPTITNRSYKGKTITASNTMDLKTILDTKAVMKDKPVIVAINTGKPMIFNEFENKIDGLLIHFAVSGQALMEIISGNREPSGLLPLQMPKNMSTVEKQFEDVPFDLECHQDSEGHVYDFGYGMNWKGQIKDARTEKYHK